MPSPDKASLHRKRFVAIATAVGIAVAVAALARFGAGDHWREKIHGLPALALIAGFAILPLVGFPATVLLLAVGARFGFWPGLGITAVVIAFHLFASYPIAGLVRKPVTSMLSKAGWKIPELDSDTEPPFSAFVALVPGLSYTLKNYAAPIAGVRFRIYFLTYYPVHLGTSVLGLMLGGAAMHFSWWAAAAIAIYAAVMIVLTRTTAKRLKAKHAFAFGAASSA